MSYGEVEPFVINGLRPAEVRTVNPSTGGEKGQKAARFDLLPWDVIWLDALHYGRGAEKYESRNWEKGYNVSLSLAAAFRHLVLFALGEDVDAETGVPHPVNVRFHMAAVVRFMEKYPELDDRSKVGLLAFTELAAQLGRKEVSTAA